MYKVLCFLILFGSPVFASSLKINIAGTAQGQIEIEVAVLIHRPVIGEEIFIPAQAIHTVRNVGTVPNVWYYGYRVAKWFQALPSIQS